MRPLITTAYAVAAAHVSRPKTLPPPVRDIAYDDTLPVPAVVCSCGVPYSTEEFDALELAAGHRGIAKPVMGLVIRICSACTSSVSVPEEWPWDSLQYPLEDDGGAFGVSDEVPDSDGWDEADARAERARNARMWRREP